MILGLTGLARSGKDSVADFFEEAELERVHRFRFADDLKRICREVYDWTVEHTDGALKDTPDERYPRPCDSCASSNVVEWPEPCDVCDGTRVTYLTPRQAMQLLGTNWARVCYPNTWVDLTMRRAAEVPDEQIVLVTDVRYINEAKGVLGAGGMIVQVQRPGVASTLSGKAQLHTSEVEQKSAAFQALVTHTFINDGTLDDLKEQAISWLTTQWQEADTLSSTPAS